MKKVMNNTIVACLMMMLFIVPSGYLLKAQDDHVEDDLLVEETVAEDDHIFSDTVDNLRKIADVTETTFSALSSVVGFIKSLWEAFMGWISNVADGGLVNIIKDVFGAVADAFDWVASFLRDTAIPLTDELD